MAAYYITGIAGSGKSTTLEALQKHGIVGYDIDAVPGVCHWQHKETGEHAKYETGVGKEWIEAHDWICDEIQLKKIIDQHRNDNVVIVGIASNQENYFRLFDKIFLLFCNEKTFIHRLNTRSNGNGFARDASEQAQILSWYKSFQDRMIAKGAIPINTEASIESVVDNVFTEMKKI